MNRAGVFAGLMGLSVALSGCMSMTDTGAPGPDYAAERGVEGSWVDDNGIVSTFRDGRFRTMTTDTNTVMATGTYSRTGDDLVQIDMHSRVSNRDASVNCAQVAPNQLNCTSDSGAQFVLERTNAPLGRVG
ncbi:hypothetical protein [Pararhizobium mangrovi]|uniref:Lipoprotein n=1 Tax=Pararhizobium mangrovi TaxID=2590452 RepID=A0A506U9D3_9HYPH|nr:hypothetical protein [Pararhizobium mangrovi]TPW29966.1 hypothetical protein FJU11_06790 [Pararhizobium mangrovi]